MEEKEPLTKCNLQSSRKIVSSSDESKNKEMDPEIQEPMQQQEDESKEKSVDEEREEDLENAEEGGFHSFQF